LRTSTNHNNSGEKKPFDPRIPSFGVALSPKPTPFAPLLFSGRLPQGFQAAAEAGFQAIELSLRTADEVNLEELNTLLDLYGLSISAIATGRSYIEDNLSFANLEADVQDRLVLRIKEHIRLAAQFDAAVIIGGVRGRFHGTASEQIHQRDIAINSIRECAKFAKELGVTILIEPINRYETNFINLAGDGFRLLDEISEPSVKLLLDTFHMNIEEVNISASIQLAGNRLGYIHFADSNRFAPGLGHTDFVQVMHALNSIHYQGVITAEILPVPDDLAAIRQAGTYLKTLYSRP
jgi:sugar phosphate isomerase/epimerase